MSENPSTKKFAAALARGAASIRDDYRAGGAKALLRNRAAQVCGGVAVLAVILFAQSGEQSGLEVKGLRLGMPVEDAARVMLGLGLPPGGITKWDESYSVAEPKYNEARYAHDSQLLAEKWRKYGVKNADDLAKHVLDPAAYAKAAKEGNLALLREYSAAPVGDFLQIGNFLQTWEALFGRPLFSKEEQFPPIKDYVAKQYPGGVPHEFGGLWKGTEPLHLEPGDGGNSTLSRTLMADSWDMTVDPQRRVRRIVLSAGATAALFGSGDMSGKEFAQSFADAYGIELLKPAPVKTGELERYFSDSFVRMGWECVDREHGWAVRIDETKVLTMTSVARASETKFN